jgi:D-alanyl-D-alanine carboxypeptidase/D-alanyl-D-alanine-endopeptidase (penicillin-binding protein 4)
VDLKRQGLLLISLCGTLLSSAAQASESLARAPLAALQSDISHQLALAGRANGAFVYDLTAKKTLFSERAQTPRPPASVEKLYTATAALGQMGAAARLSTSVYGVGHPTAGGTWEGSLYLRGGGDPTFGSSGFIAAHYGGIGAGVSTLVTQLVRRDGIHHITGSIRGDESFLDPLRGEPSSGYAFDVFLEGTLSGLAFNRGAGGSERGAHAPAAYAARELWRALKGDGVTVAGGAGAATTPAGATLLAAVPSPTVTELLGLMLPPSDNFFAETLTKDMGALYGGAGTTSAGAGVIRRSIAAMLGFSPRVVDGSGLSRADKTSPYQVVQLLAGLYPTPIGGLLREHLAVAGRTGTLARRMRRTRAEGRCQGKTGTLEGASNLAGYCRAANGHVLAFAVFTDAISIESAHIFQDHIAISLASSKLSEAELAGVAARR